MGWLPALLWVRRLGMYAAAAGAFVTALAALRRSAERSRRLKGQVEHERRMSDARQRMLDASQNRPRGRGDFARRISDGEF